MSDLVQSGMSFMEARNKRGPRTVPCGTPERTSAVVDIFPSMMTCVRHDKKLSIQLMVCPLTP